MDRDELLIILESAKSHFDFYERLDRRYEDAEIILMKLSEIRDIGKDITLALNILKKA